MNGPAFGPGPPTGAPLLIGTPYWFEARVVDSVKAGDHSVFVAEVITAGVRDDSVEPLVLRDTGLSYGG